MTKVIELYIYNFLQIENRMIFFIYSVFFAVLAFSVQCPTDIPKFESVNNGNRIDESSYVNALEAHFAHAGFDDDQKQGFAVYARALFEAGRTMNYPEKQDVGSSCYSVTAILAQSFYGCKTEAQY